MISCALGFFDVINFTKFEQDSEQQFTKLKRDDEFLIVRSSMLGTYMYKILPDKKPIEF